MRGEIMASLTLARAIDGFILSKSAEGRAKQSTDWYRHNLIKFSVWLKSLHAIAEVDGVTAQHIREFLQHLRDPHPKYVGHRFRKANPTEGSAQRSILGAFASLSAFFNWAVSDGVIRQSPTANIKRPKVAKQIVPIFTREEMQALLAACDSGDDGITARNKAILTILLDTGIRLSEIVGLRMDRINIQDGSAQVTGKGAKDRSVFFGAYCKKQLWRYISMFRPESDASVTQVLLNKDGTPMHGRRLHTVVSDLGKKAGIANVHPHRFRHTAAVQFLRNGGNIFALQKMLGHNTLEMVRYYVELSQEDVKNVHKTASPADNWKLG
jgi:site-specific recombinase XerD